MALSPGLRRAILGTTRVASEAAPAPATEPEPVPPEEESEERKPLPTITSQQARTYLESLPPGIRERAMLEALPPPYMREYEALDVRALNDWEVKRAAELMDDPIQGGMTREKAENQARRERTQQETQEGQYNQPSAETGFGQRLLRAATRVSGHLTGESSVPTQTLRAMGERELLHPDTQYGAEEEREKGNPKLAALKRLIYRKPDEPEILPVGEGIAAMLIDAPLAGRVSVPAVAGAREEAIRGAADVPGRTVPDVEESVVRATVEARKKPQALPLSESERKPLQEDWNAEVAAIYKKWGDDTQTNEERHAAKVISDTDYEAERKRIDGERQEAIDALTKLQPSMFRELFGAASAPTEALAGYIAEKGPEQPVKTVLDFPALLPASVAAAVPHIAAHAKEAARVAKTEVPEMAGEIASGVAKAARDLAKKPETPGEAADLAVRAGRAVTALGSGLSGIPALLTAAPSVAGAPAKVEALHAMQGLAAGTVPLVGENRGQMMEAPITQGLRNIGQTASSLFTTKVGRAAREAGLSERAIAPLSSMPLYDPNEPWTTSMQRPYRFAAELVQPFELFKRNYWLDRANTIATNRGMQDEMGDIARALPIERDSPASKALVAAGLVADFAFPYEELAFLPFAIAGRAIPRATRAARLGIAARAPAGDVARVAAVAAEVPGSAARVGKTMGVAPDVHSIVTNVQLRGTARQAAETGHIEVPHTVRDRVQQEAKNQGFDYADLRERYIEEVGDQSVVRGPEQTRVEAEVRNAVRGKIHRESDVDAALDFMQGAARAGVENGRWASVEDYYKGVEYGRADAYDPAKAAGQALLQDTVEPFYSPLTRQVEAAFDRWGKTKAPPAPDTVRFEARGPSAVEPPAPRTFVAGTGMPGYGPRHIREASRVAVRDPFLAADLGIKVGDEVPKGQLFEAILRKSYMEDNRIKFPTRLVAMTRNTVVPATRVGAFQSKFEATVRSLTGSEFSDFPRLMEIVDLPGGEKEARIILQGGPGGTQATGFKMMVRDLMAYGLDRLVPRRLQDQNADWSYITLSGHGVTPSEYNALLAGTMDLIAGPGVRRNRVAEALPTNYAEQLVNAVLAKPEWVPGGRLKEGSFRAQFRQGVHWFEKLFVKDDPWSRLAPDARAIVDVAVRRIARIPDEILDEVKDLHRLRERARPGALGQLLTSEAGKAEAPGGLHYISDVLSIFPHGQPGIVTDLFHGAHPPVIYNESTRFAFAPFNFGDIDQPTMIPAPGLSERTKFAAARDTPGAASARADAVAEAAEKQMPDLRAGLLADPETREKWLTSVENMFRDGLGGMTDSERFALRRVWSGSNDSDDLSHLAHGVFKRRMAILKRADEILEAVEGQSEGLIKTIPIEEKLRVYDWFYNGEWDRIEAMFQSHNLKPTDRGTYVMALVARGRADEIVQDMFRDLYDNYLLKNTDEAWDARLKIPPAGEDTLKRSARFQDHANALGFKTDDEVNLFYRAYQHKTQGMDAVTETHGWRHLLYSADKEETAIVDELAKGNKPPSTREAKYGRALHVTSNNVEKVFKTKADADAAIQALRDDMVARGWDPDTQRAMLKGSVPSPGNLSDYYRAVTDNLFNIFTGWDQDVVVKFPDGRPAQFHRSGLKTADPMAYVEALDFINRFGLHPASKSPLSPEVLRAPGGMEMLLPASMVDEIKKAMNDSIPLAMDFSSKGGVEQKLAEIGLMKHGRPAFIMLNNLNAMVKQGMTIGLAVMNPAFLMTQAFGNLTYVYMHEGLRGVARQTFFHIKHPKMTWQVSMALRRGAPSQALDRVIVTKNGTIYTVHDVSRLAVQHGLDSSWVKSDFIQSFDQDIQRYLSTTRRNIDQFRLGPYRRCLLDVSQFFDNSARVGEFIDKLIDGVAPGEAAAIARRIILDYSDLSDFEKTTLRQVVLFYSYMRKNLANIWWAFLHNPSRVVGQLRLANGITKYLYDKDAAAISNDYSAGRVAIYGRRMHNRMDAAGVRWFLPPVSAADAFTLGITGFTANNPDSFVRLSQSLNPIAAYFMRRLMKRDPYFDRALTDPMLNKIPAFFVAYDNTITGGILARYANFKPIVNLDPNDMLDPWGGHDITYVASGEAGALNWQDYINLWGPWLGALWPPLGVAPRTLTTGTAFDRADIGIVEAIPHTFGRQGYRRFLESIYSAAGRTPPDVPTWVWETEHRKGMSPPRVGMTRAGELLGVGGITAKIDVPPDVLQNELNKAINLEVQRTKTKEPSKMH